SSALGTVPAMALIMLMIVTLVPTLLIVCNAKKKREKEAMERREKEKEEEKKKKERSEKERHDKIMAIVDARMQTQDEVREKKWQEEKPKRIAELMKEGATKEEAEWRANEIDAQDRTTESERDIRRTKMFYKVEAELKRKQEKVRKKRSQDREDFGKFERDLMSCEDKKDTFSAQETKSNEKINASPEKPEKKKDVITKVTNSNEKIAPTLVK
ncbi:hypothetical protein PFISCL1PPCAC_18174, partial [Pristionchus fissidentatus]